MNADAFDLRPYLFRNARSVTVWVALAGLILFGLLRYENFSGAYNITSFLNYNAMFIAIAMGMCFVIMTGGIDLSVGSVAAFTSIVAAYLSPWGLQVAMPAALLTGVALGAVNAFCIVALRIPPFIATLAMMLGAKGGALVISGAQSIAVDWGSNFTKLGMEKTMGILPWSIVVVIGLVVALWVVLERTSLGLTVLAIGGSEDASTLMGLRVNRAKTFVYLLSGGCAGLAGVFLASGFGAGQPLEGVGWELSAIACVVVGGTLLTGGLGSVPATVAGALLLGLIFNILNFENGRGTISFSAYWQLVIRGMFLFAVILFQSYVVGRKAKGGGGENGCRANGNDGPAPLYDASALKAEAILARRKVMVPRFRGHGFRVCGDLARALTPDRLLHYQHLRIVAPMETEDGLYREIDIRRITLLCKLSDDMELDEDALVIVMSLLDQLHGARAARRRHAGTCGRRCPGEGTHRQPPCGLTR